MSELFSGKCLQVFSELKINFWLLTSVPLATGIIILNSWKYVSNQIGVDKNMDIIFAGVSRLTTV